MKQKTPIKKLIEYIDTLPYAFTQSLEIRAKATELLAEEREGFEEAYWNGQKNIFGKKQDYFTQTYGGGDE